VCLGPKAINFPSQAQRNSNLLPSQKEIVSQSEMEQENLCRKETKKKPLAL